MLNIDAVLLFGVLCMSGEVRELSPELRCSGCNKMEREL